MLSDFERNLGDIERRANLGEVILTKFLDLDEQTLASSLKKHFNLTFFGGFSNAERKRAIINLKNPKLREYNIIAYEIIYSKTLAISHKNILGTIMSLGIKRNTFGDIIVSGQKAYLIVTTEISSYIESEFTKINTQRIELKRVSYQQLENIMVDNLKEMTVIVPSLRLDVIVSQGFKMNRSDVSHEIEAGLVFVNNKTITKPDYLLNIGDIISFRRHGRIKFSELGKITKKNRIVIKLQIYE